MRERQDLDRRISDYDRFEQALEDGIALAELGEEEGDEDAIREAVEALSDLKSQVARRELETLLAGEADANDAYLEVHAGAGGTESQDWAQMLTRMYIRWA